MIGKTILSLGGLVAFASAQSAPGFPIEASRQLTVAFGNNTVSPPGELIPRGETAQPPSIRSPAWSTDGNGSPQGLLLMVDLDVPRNGTRVQLVHWLATNVTLGNSNSSGSALLNVPNGPVPYLQPSPPVGDVPHAYTFIVFPQPAGFVIPPQYAGLTQSRVPFNTLQFVSDAGLGQAFAANYIRVQNLTGTPTTTYPPARPTSSGASNSSVPIPFPGAAQPLAVGGTGFWAGITAALIAAVAAVAL
ncbi:phosphatidylethanolamine-binding protein [Paraphoma chrysanthemicola]|uniref:Phosphatidylethanolamine-binding protein n=1 Tax=Paraphoma chrysanthemicola TaxID=798071 RepID=A0A8K0W410_9PLEO|nr:phosphatidylethanolamine-binding protein [Paraphoma chrysanthemicola]